MANDFSQDPSVVALWRFESGSLTTDSKGTNTLTNHGVTADTVNYEEGAASAKFVASGNQYLNIADASLSSDFPFKNGSGNNQGTFCFYFTPTSASLSGYPAIIGKVIYGTAFSFAFDIRAGILSVVWGYGSGGSSYETWNLQSLTANHTYHIGIALDSTGKAGYAIIKDITTGIINVYSNVFNNQMQINTIQLCIGSESNPTNYIDGRIDELVVFNRLLNWTALLAVINNTYSGIIGPPYGNNIYNGDNRFKAVWQFEPGALTVDSQDSNTLTLHAGPISGSAPNIMEGSGSVATETGYFDIADANLDSDFPLKNGDTVQQITICNWIGRDIAGIYPRNIWSKGTDIGLAYDNQSGVLLGLGGFRAFLRYKNNIYDLGFNFPLSPIAIAVAIDGLAKTAHVRYYNPVTEITTNKELSFAQQLGTNTNAFMVGDTVSSWVGTIDGMVVAAAVLTDDEIDQIFAGTFSPPSAPPDNCLSLTFCESIPAALAPCLSLTTCEEIPIVYPLDNCLSLTACPGIELQRLSPCLSLSHCPELPKGAPASVIASTKCQDIPLASGRGTFLIFS
jgi:hypothetical protein